MWLNYYFITKLEHDNTHTFCRRDMQNIQSLQAILISSTCFTLFIHSRSRIARCFGYLVIQNFSKFVDEFPISLQQSTYSDTHLTLLIWFFIIFLLIRSMCPNHLSIKLVLNILLDHLAISLINNDDIINSLSRRAKLEMEPIREQKVSTYISYL